MAKTVARAQRTEWEEQRHLAHPCATAHLAGAMGEGFSGGGEGGKGPPPPTGMKIKASPWREEQNERHRGRRDLSTLVGLNECGRHAARHAAEGVAFRGNEGQFDDGGLKAVGRHGKHVRQALHNVHRGSGAGGPRGPRYPLVPPHTLRNTQAPGVIPATLSGPNATHTGTCGLEMGAHTRQAAPRRTL